MNRLKNVLLYGGIEKENYEILKPDIDTHNRKNIVTYSVIGVIFCAVLFIVTSLQHSVISKNKMLYLAGCVIIIAIGLANYYLGKKNSVFINIAKYAFMILLFGLGILLAVNSYYDISASYMVLLFAIPLLFLLKPIFNALLIILTDVVYLSVMSKLQTPDLFSKDLVNAVVFGVLSICISTSIISVKIKSLETDYINRELMRTDRLTGLLNRQAYMDLISTYEEEGMQPDTVCVVLDLNELKFVNDNFGHWVGDRLIISAAECITKAFAEYGSIFRTGGDEFSAILTLGEEEFKAALENFSKAIADHNEQCNDSLSVSIGYAEARDSEYGTFEEISRLADQRMYQNKNEYYKQSGKDRRK